MELNTFFLIARRQWHPLRKFFRWAPPAGLAPAALARTAACQPCPRTLRCPNLRRGGATQCGSACSAAPFPRCARWARSLAYWGSFVPMRLVVYPALVPVFLSEMRAAGASWWETLVCVGAQVGATWQQLRPPACLARCTCWGRTSAGPGHGGDESLRASARGASAAGAAADCSCSQPRHLPSAPAICTRLLPLCQPTLALRNGRRLLPQPRAAGLCQWPLV